jgi:hypothetical protein
MMQDIIRDTEIYQHIMQEGVEQEMQKEIQRLRQMLITFVQARADELVPFATTQAEKINDVEVLNELALKVGLAQNVEEIRRYLNAANEKDKH